MPRSLNMTGRRFGKLVVLSFSHKDIRQNKYWECQCDCGSQTTARGSHLTCGNITSCGCSRVERMTTHGLSKTKTYEVWTSMRRRCNQPTDPAYKDYGARGIRICDRWDEYQNFVNDMGECPKGMSINRIDNNGNYEPSNCEWSTRKEQANNTRRNRKITHNGETKTMQEWADFLNVSSSAIQARLNNGWTDDKAIETPLKRQS